MTISLSHHRIKYMEERDRQLLHKLVESFSGQLSLYTQLRDNVRGLMSKLVLSRGDVSGLVRGLDSKGKLLEQISEERSGIAGEIKLWQERKKECQPSREVEAFELLLAKMERVIQEFLDEEQKLKSYLEKVYRNESGER